MTEETARSGPVTIYDVAKAAGVAPSTVSRAFSRPGRVNSTTANRIQAIADELGYRAAPLVLSPQRTDTKLVSLLVSDITNPVFFAIIRGAESVATARGFTMVLTDSQESAVLERQALDRALGTVDGIVLATSRMSDSAIRATAQRKPLVLLNRIVTDVPSVVADNHFGISRAVEHLVSLGHESICYLAGPEASWADGVRWSSLRSAAAESEIRVRRIGPLTPTIMGATAAVDEFMAHPTTAVLAYNDLLAIGFMKQVQAHGLRVPEDVSIIGFDNSYGSDLVTPSLTTIAASLRAMGTTAMTMVLDQLKSKKPGTLQPTLLPTRLIIRDSTGPAKS
jgi:LacI family repressor for deo operon, udp, cdd, tsx, nupC, and nupG